MSRLWIVSLFFINLIAGVALAQQLPTPPPDWKLETVLSAPDVKHPSVVCCGPDGRVFVAEDPMDISLPKASAAEGRIICIHPDGKRTVFAEKLFAVFGMQYLDGKLYVMHNPKFSVFVDDNGVGRERVDLIEQTNPNPWALEWNDHVPANFKLAMDGYFYIAVGDKGLYNCVGRDGKRVDLKGGGVVRMRPDGTGLEIYCTGVRNILDIAINEEDELFTYDNTDEHDWMGRFTHMVDGGFYGYPYDFVPRRPYTLWMIEDFGGGAATGTLCYTEDALPPAYHGNMFLADFGKRQILRVAVERAGATYRVTSKSEMFSDVPAEFRPVGICLSPDGKSIYICDWQHADSKEKVTVGRLLKMTYMGKTSEKRKPEWYVGAAMGNKVDVAVGELIAALSHPAREVRMVAQRRVAERGEEAMGLLQELIRDGKPLARARAHAIWALNAMNLAEPKRQVIFDAMIKGDPAVRRQAIRHVGLRKVELAESWLHSIRQDRDASLRFEVATALGRMGGAQSLGVLQEMLKDADGHVRFAAWTALNSMGRRDGKHWPQIAIALVLKETRIVEGTEFALRETYDMKLVEALEGMTRSELVPVMARESALRILAPLCRKHPQWKGEWWAYHPALAPVPEKNVDWEGTPIIRKTLRERLDDDEPAVRRAAIDGIALAKDSASAPMLGKLFGVERDAQNQRAIVYALGILKQADSIPLLMAVLKNHLDDSQLLIEAIEAAKELAAPELADSLSRHLPDRSAEVAIGVVRALGKISGDGVTQTIAGALQDTRAEVRREAARVLGDRRAAAAVPELLAVVDDAQMGAAAIGALVKIGDARALEVYLRVLEGKDAALREQVRGAIARIADQVLATLELRAGKLPQQVVGELQKALAKHERARNGPIFAIKVKLIEAREYQAFAMKNPGDAARGRKLFEDEAGMGCIRCHSVGGKGGSIGPDLSATGSQFSRELLIESILYPSRSIREGYQVYTVKTRRGDWFDGLHKGENDASVMLLDSAGTLHTIPKSDVVSQRASSVSLMPEGLHSALSPEEFADLIAYLQTLKSGALRAR